MAVASEAQRGRSQHQYDRQSSWRTLRLGWVWARNGWKLTARCTERAQAVRSVRDASASAMCWQSSRASPRASRGTLAKLTTGA